MSSIYGKNIQISLFGESHGAAVGVVLDGLPAGEPVDLKKLQAFCARRASGAGQLGATTRCEPDEIEILSGLYNGKTAGSPLAALIRNTAQQPEDYEPLRNTPRPGHADYPLELKHHGAQDKRGGGHHSGRLTAALCLAGGVCLQLLAARGVSIVARVTQSGDIEAARAEGDSVGGIIECTAQGLPAGLGAPHFEGVENRMAQAIFAIPAVRGIEFGTGFAAAAMRGSEHNDEYYFEGNGRVRTRSNNHGGVLGGLTTGMPLVFCVAFKPPSSIARAQKSVNLATGKEVSLSIAGRHDVSIVPRAVPVVEAVCACVLLDLMSEQ